VDQTINDLSVANVNAEVIQNIAIRLQEVIATAKIIQKVNIVHPILENKYVFSDDPNSFDFSSFERYLLTCGIEWLQGSSYQCWKHQCSKCREYYLGSPSSEGHQCYRQMHVDTDYCFDPKSQESCLIKPKPLLSGRTVFFAVQPKFMNVNIRINLDVTHGAINFFLSPKDDTFLVTQTEKHWAHKVKDKI